jgi:hypothetical protein
MNALPRVLIAASFLVCSGVVHAQNGGPDTPLPNVTWSLKDSISACPAGDSVIAGHPSRLRVLVRYDEKEGLPTDSIWVTYSTLSGNARLNDEGAKIYIDDPPNAVGNTRITVPSLSGSGTVRVTLFVSGTNEGYLDVHIRTTDTNASDRTTSADLPPPDLNWNGSTDATDSAAVQAHVNHWKRNALHGTLIERTHFDGTNSFIGEGKAFWSPSGRYVSFAAHDSAAPSKCHIFIVASNPTDGGDNARKVTNASASDYDPAWSPQNDVLIYGRGDTTIYGHSLQGFGGNGSTYVVKRHNDGSTTFPRGAIIGTISPDGQWVAFSQRDTIDGPVSLYKIPIDGDLTKQRKLTKPPHGTADWYPQWSPDGSWVIFQRQSSDTLARIYRVRANGDSTQPIREVYTNAQGKPSTRIATNPAYSPDSLIVLAAVGPQVEDSVFTHTIDPSLGTIPAIANYAENRFASKEDDLTFPILGPLLSPDGTRLLLASEQIWATRRNMSMPPRFTDIGGAVADTTSIVSKTVQCEGSIEFTVAASDPEGDALTYGAMFLPNGASFSSSTRTFSWSSAGPCGASIYVKFLVTTSSGGTDAILCKITVGGLLGQTGGTSELSASVFHGPNPTTGRILLEWPPGARGPLHATVYDLGGRALISLTGRAPAQLEWDGKTASGTRVPPGVYLYRVEGGGVSKNGKIVILH